MYTQLSEINYVDQMAQQIYKEALRKAFWRNIHCWLTSHSNILTPLNREALADLIWEQREIGLQTIHLDQIVGSEGRMHEFDRAFFPRQTHTQDRWLNIARARYQNVILPPVELLKANDKYFVTDGHHRISVARAMGQEIIEGQVRELVTVADFAFTLL